MMTQGFNPLTLHLNLLCCVYHATFNTISHVKYEEEYRKFNTITAQGGVGVQRVGRGVGQQEALMVVVEGEEGGHPREH